MNQKAIDAKAAKLLEKQKANYREHVQREPFTRFQIRPCVLFCNEHGEDYVESYPDLITANGAAEDKDTNDLDFGFARKVFWALYGKTETGFCHISDHDTKLGACLMYQQMTGFMILERQAFSDGQLDGLPAPVLPRVSLPVFFSSLASPCAFVSTRFEIDGCDMFHVINTNNDEAFQTTRETILDNSEIEPTGGFPDFDSIDCWVRLYGVDRDGDEDLIDEIESETFLSWDRANEWLDQMRKRYQPDSEAE